MGTSSGMGQLAKGIVIGIVLLLAIIGTMSIFESSSDQQIYLPSSTDTTEKTKPDKAPAPVININENQNEKKIADKPIVPPITVDPVLDAKVDAKTNAKTDPKIEPVTPPPPAKEKESKKTANNFKPTLENERILKEKKVVQYGLLQVRAINPSNSKKLLAHFVVLDKKGKRVASAKSISTTSFRLPVGKYKVITTLKKPDNAARSTQVVKSIKTVRISSNKKTTQTFKLDPPSTIGILQVTAKNANNGRTIKANYTIQEESGRTIATRNNVTQTLFKLKAGSYRVTVKSGSNSDFRTIVVEPGESTNQVFTLQETIKLGKVRVRVLETRTNKPLKADIIISMSNGVPMQQLRAVSQTEISLPEGQYKIRVTGPVGQSSKNIRITAGQALNEIFRFNAPKPATEVKITETTKITPPKKTPQVTVTPPVVKPPEVKKQDLTKGTILLYARNEGNNIPLKSNFYIQKTNGKNVAKKVYIESAQFSLDPGIYRVTVRSKNRKNITKTIRIASGERISEFFSLKSSLPKPINTTNNPPPVKKVSDNTSRVSQATLPPVLAPQKPPKPASKTSTVPNGFLSVAMQPPRKTHFIVATRSGKKIVELTSVPNAKFKLDTGDYVVTAIQNKQRKAKTVTVRSNKTTNIRFNAASFQPPRRNARNQAITKGILKSRIINRAGTPLRGDLTVTNMRGQVVARANSVTVGVFNLPPVPHTIILNYKGLRGSERVSIRPNETTMQTFTVAPNNQQRPQNNNQAPPPREKRLSLEEMLRDRLEREIRSNF